MTPRHWLVIRSLEGLARRLADFAGPLNRSVGLALAAGDSLAVAELDATHAQLRERREQLEAAARARRWALGRSR